MSDELREKCIREAVMAFAGSGKFHRTTGEAMTAVVDAVLAVLPSEGWERVEGSWLMTERWPNGEVYHVNCASPDTCRLGDVIVNHQHVTRTIEPLYRRVDGAAPPEPERCPTCASDRRGFMHPACLALIGPDHDEADPWHGPIIFAVPPSEEREADLGSCPYFAHREDNDPLPDGWACGSCVDEPACVTEEPAGGWPSRRPASSTPTEVERLREFIQETIDALRAANTIGQRSCREGDGLNYGFHDRLIRNGTNLLAALSGQQDTERSE